MTAPGPAEPSTWRRLLRSIGVFLTFSLIGPAIGGTLVLCAVFPVMTLLGVNTSTAPPTSPQTFQPLDLLGLLVIFVGVAYAFGGVAAMLTGLWAAVTGWRQRLVSGGMTALVASAATLIWIALVHSPLDPMHVGDMPPAARANAALWTAVTNIPIAIVAALFCRWLCRKTGLLTGA